MRVGARSALVAALMVTTIACASDGVFRQYEYEEDLYVSLDGSATLYVNTSIAALNALRGTTFNTAPDARVDRQAITAFFASPITRVTRRVSTSRRNNRQFVHVRLDVDDVRRLGDAPPFRWSAYRFSKEGDQFVYEQHVGAPAGGERGNAGWNGQELVAFRLHVPSKILGQNAGQVRRGNILAWEQNLSDRLAGVPVELQARMAAQSILYRTLFLFGATLLVVAMSFALVIWWVFRRGAEPAHT